MWLSMVSNTICWIDYLFPVVYSWLLCWKLIDQRCMVLCLVSVYCSIFLCLFIYYVREHKWDRGREIRKRESQEGSILSAQGLMWSWNSQTVRSWPEPKPRVGCFTDWTTQAPLYIVLLICLFVSILSCFDYYSFVI